VQTDGTGQHEIGGEGNRDTSSAVWDPTGTFVGIVDNRCDAPCTFEVIRVATGGRRLVTSRRGLDQLVWIGALEALPRSRVETTSGQPPPRTTATFSHTL
jgi:hypothetical protein